jgi:hypothetical protein
MRRSLVGLVALFFLLVFSSLSAWAQFESGLTGTVTDPSGAVVPGATVAAKDVETGILRTVQTGSAGNYNILSLPAHLFEITVSAKGFKSTVQQNIRLEVKQMKEVNFFLQLGAASTEVTVTAAPPAVDISQARVSTEINQASVANLPMVARNLYSLVVLTPGITGLPSGGSQAYAQATADIYNMEYGVNLSANGQRSESNSFLIDGGSVNSSPRGGVTNLTPNVDSIQELRVQVNNFSAEYGRNSSSVTNMVTKSGNNGIHGTMDYVFTNNSLTAGNIFQPDTIERANGTFNKLPVFQRNEGNWSLGGPIRKDHTFFFGSMDILRSGAGSTGVNTAVTPDFINYMEANYPNNISTSVMKNYLPSGTREAVNMTAASLANNTTCTGTESITTPIGAMPCNLDIAQFVDSSVTLPRNGLQWNFRIDQSWGTGNNRLYGNWYRMSVTSNYAVSAYPAFTQQEPGSAEYANVDFTHIFSPNLLLETAVTFTRPRGSATLGAPDIPQINVPGISTYGMDFSGPSYIQSNGEWRNVLSWNRGTHAFKMGEDFAHDNGWASGVSFGPEHTRYFYNFHNMYDFALDTPYEESNYGFDPATGQQGGLNFSPKFNRLGLFYEDAWKAKPNLTVNYGVRWEWFMNPNEQHHPEEYSRIVFNGGTDFDSRIADAGVIRARPLATTDKHNFAPRVGIAWDPTGKGKMSVRAGWGMFYDRPGGQFWPDSNTTLPVYATVTGLTTVPTGPQPVFGLGTASGGLVNNYLSYLTSSYGFPPMTGIVPGLNSHGGLLGGVLSSISITDPHLQTQYSENWFIGMQYALSNNWVIEGNYVGSVGRHLYQNYDVNRVDGSLITNDDVLVRLNPYFGAIDYGQANGESYYKSVNFSIKKRFSRGLDMQAAYTYGKAMDTASTFGNELNMVDMSNLRANYGLSDFDVRQKLAASLVYDLPGPKGPGAKSKLLGGWQAGTVIILQKGTPYSVYNTLPFEPVYNAAGTTIIGNTGGDYNADGLNYDYPDEPSFGRFKKGNKQEFLSGIFTASQFPAPALGQEGNLGRNSYIGPGYINCDFNVVKATPIPWFWNDEAAKFEFRADFFNLFNNVNLQNPDGSMSDGTFGLSTAVYPARNIQFGLKIIF